MTDMHAERLAAVVRAICACHMDMTTECAFPSCSCRPDTDRDVRRAHAAIAADDAHHAAQARGMVTEDVVERARRTWDQADPLPGDTEQRRAMRAALEAVAPMLVPRAPLPAEVTDGMIEAAYGEYEPRAAEMTKMLRRMIRAALAAAPEPHASDCATHTDTSAAAAACRRAAQIVGPRGRDAIAEAFDELAKVLEAKP